ncbi:hypothetical protein [Fulvivirga sedimenti]|uniref:Anti-sigma factor n=1 Tax=Fulvivirga sedimenti TaxID=2879465 RepID=A0A9X1HNS8_9BACT|nr:hypothetical protein [Fulvivirga sedimenti]MCA6073589.1 hypothetical protein [Fulvivirga sedimenti]
MKNNLENFISENRDAFDHREPRNVWEKISRNLPNGRPSTHWMWKAAAVLFFVTTVGLLINTLSPGDQPRLAQQQNLDAQFNEVESFYFQQISEKRTLIDELQQDNIYEIDVVAELQKLDAMYLVLRNEYKENPSPEVVDALTLNLLVRIDLLNRTLERLDQPEEMQIEI